MERELQTAFAVRNHDLQIEQMRDGGIDTSLHGEGLALFCAISPVHRRNRCEGQSSSMYVTAQAPNAAPLVSAEFRDGLTPISWRLG